MRLNVFKRSQKQSTLPLFDENFLLRLERLSFRTAPTLRGARSGDRRSRDLRPALDFSDHRLYAPGDDWRYIDWHAYSRHEELFVKLGETTQSVNVHILLDCSRSMVWSPAQSVRDIESNLQNPRSNKWDSARRLAGALGYLGLAGGERLELTPFTHTLGDGFGPTRGKRQVIPLLRFLTTIRPAAGRQEGSRGVSLVHNLADYARRYPRGGVLVIISDLLDTVTPFSSQGNTPDWGELAEGLRHFPPPRWQVLVLHLLTEAELHPALAGDIDLQDMETGESLPFHLDEATLAQYRLRVRRWCAEVQSACAKRAATYARILAEWPMEQSVIPYLRRLRAIQ
jgi:hypothetical protein